MKKRGRGFACMMYSIGVCAIPNPSAAVVKVHDDGSAVVSTGAAELGQGFTTAICQIAAEELGIPYEKVAIVSADTDTCPYDLGTGASRVTYTTGNAVRLAAAAAKQMLFEVAAERLRVSPEALEAKDGYIYVKGAPEKRVSIAHAASASRLSKGKPITTTASFNPPNSPLDPETGQGVPFPSYVYATQIVDVEVDTETGEVKVLKFVAAHDVGRAVNPALVEGQIYSGVSHGLGYVLMEDIAVDEKGRILNPGFTDYLVPTAADTPEIEAIIVEENEPTGPFGAKGCGEPPNVPAAPAILNAIYDAVGVRLKSLPATPEKVLRALKEKGTESKP